jgi:N-acetylglucosaminyldiphosphoundecaprenol N-acetyl-beta-D-mannosaminyltransferase
MKQLERIRILDVPIDVINMHGAIEAVNSSIRENVSKDFILAVNPEKIFALKKDSYLKLMFEKADLLVPDGIGVVLAVRLLYGQKISRVPGADLMQNLCREASLKGYRIYVYGATEEVNKKAVEKLKKSYPGIIISGRRHGYIPEENMDGLIDDINKSKSDILFVGLGSPKQEQWIEKYMFRLNIKICQGIGGTLDTIAGNVKRAPIFFSESRT